MNAAVTELKAQAAAAEFPGPGETLIGECIDSEHPSLKGRVQVTWTHDGPEQRAWVPTLTGLALRAGDRVLLTRPSNHDEPVVIGVLDGLVTRRDAAKERGPALELKSDEALRVHAHDGTPILEVTATDRGPAVRLLESQGRVIFPGKLSMQAEGIEFEATKGEVTITASGDVRVEGEVVRLN